MKKYLVENLKEIPIRHISVVALVVATLVIVSLDGWCCCQRKLMNANITRKLSSRMHTDRAVTRMSSDRVA